ncbi:MAG: FAD-dependent oxidoreductase, partial [Oscillospiraceae bacterium]
MNSIWTQTCHIESRPNLQEALATDVAIIGGGLCGILTAYRLAEKGKKAIVLEANSIASGQTKNTTAKITAQHGAIYHKLIDTFGTEKAKEYADANSRAIFEYRHIIEKENIDCDLEEKSAFLYCLNNEHLLREEAKAAALLGLPACFVTGSRLPFEVAGFVQFEEQAQFNPLKFIKKISENLTVYENTPVISVSGNTIKTSRGDVVAQHIIFACHYPFINIPGLYFARMHQERSYVIALKNAAQLEGMYISADKKGYSFRNYGEYLFVGGKNHRTGENSNGGKYAELEAQGKKWFPGCQIHNRWSAQDCISTDSVPYIGRYSPGVPNWYVATGFNKWGMTTSLVAADILSDLVCGIKNSSSNIFSPARFSFGDIPKIAVEGSHAIKGLTREIVALPQTILAQLPTGHGGIVEFNGDKLGVYKDEQGKVYTVD